MLATLRSVGKVANMKDARIVSMLTEKRGDVTALLNAGVLNRTDDGRIEFPFQAVRVEFLLQAA